MAFNISYIPNQHIIDMAHKPRDIFQQGPVDPAFVGESIAKHASKTSIGGHGIFMGQVRADNIEGKNVSAIEYTAHEAMALEVMTRIREDIFAKYPLTCLHVHHSLGVVPAGGISLFVFASAPHRRAAIDGCAEVVERIKAELPVWGKEIFEDGSHHWKQNN
jgi:molybdopterin synthase catalytic subunit